MHSGHPSEDGKPGLMRNGVGPWHAIFLGFSHSAPAADVASLLIGVAIVAYGAMPLAMVLGVVLYLMVGNTNYSYSKNVASSGATTPLFPTGWAQGGLPHMAPGSSSSMSSIHIHSSAPWVLRPRSISIFLFPDYTISLGRLLLYTADSHFPARLLRNQAFAALCSVYRRGGSSFPSGVQPADNFRCRPRKYADSFHACADA